MSAHWKHVIKCLISEPNNDLLVSIYCIILDYRRQKIDDICSDSMLRKLEEVICEEDPEWAEEEINDVSRCDNCDAVNLDENLKQYRLNDKPSTIHEICEYCYDTHKEHYTLVDDEPIDDLIERHIETQAELSMGK